MSISRIGEIVSVSLRSWDARLRIIVGVLGSYPSGQRGLAVNQVRNASGVRIPHSPPGPSLLMGFFMCHGELSSGTGLDGAAVAARRKSRDLWKRSGTSSPIRSVMEEEERGEEAI